MPEPRGTRLEGSISEPMRSVCGFCRLRARSSKCTTVRTLWTSGLLNWLGPKRAVGTNRAADASHASCSHEAFIVVPASEQRSLAKHNVGPRIPELPDAGRSLVIAT